VCCRSNGRLKSLVHSNEVSYACVTPERWKNHPFVPLSRWKTRRGKLAEKLFFLIECVSPNLVSYKKKCHVSRISLLVFSAVGRNRASKGDFRRSLTVKLLDYLRVFREFADDLCSFPYGSVEKSLFFGENGVRSCTSSRRDDIADNFFTDFSSAWDSSAAGTL